jgi:hypothetical protein
MTNSPDLEDERLQAAQADEPDMPPLQHVTARAEPHQDQEDPEIPDRARSSTIGLLTFLAGFLFITAAVIAGYIYLIQSSPSRHLGLSDETLLSAPSPSPSPTPLQLARPAPTDPGIDLNLPMTADALHMTATALGDPHLAIVNGMRLAEGDWLKVHIGARLTAVQVAKIEDGVVHFNHGGGTPDAKLSLKSRQPGHKPPPHKRK